MPIISGLIQNASMLLALVLAYSLFLERLPPDRLGTQFLQGALFGITALTGMIYPVNLSPGVFFDARSVILSLGGLFGGPIVATVSALVAGAYRAWLGGTGVVMGLGTIATSAGIGVALHYLRRTRKVEINLATLALFGLAVHLACMGWVVVLPAEVRHQVLAQIALPFVIVFPSISVLLGLLLRMQEQRHEAAQLLRKSEHRLAEAKRLAALGNWEWALETDQHIWSPEVYALYGRNPSKPPETFPAVARYFSSETWPALFAATERAVREGIAFEREAEVIRPDGTRRWAIIRAQAERAASGQVVRLHGTIQDITEQRELFSRIEKIAAHVPGMLYQYQQWPDGRATFPYASRGIKDIYGVDPGQVVEDATPVFETLHPDDFDRIARSIAESMQQQTLWHEAYRVKQPDGRVIWVEGESTPEPQPDGSMLWHGHIRDVTQRKRDDARLLLAASVFDHSLEGIMITNADNRLVDVNPGFSRITGYTKDEVLGANPKILASGRHDAAFFDELWSSLKRDGFWQGEIWNRRKDGQLFAALLSISAVYDQDAGGLRNYIAVFADVTQIKQHEAELDQIAHYDVLTGLANRRLLMDQLNQALAQGRRSGHILAVCYLDLDGFKEINDRHGHADGDVFLIQITRALRDVLRAEDTLGRLGGDEFALLLTGLSRPEDCESLLMRILEAIRQPIEINGFTHQVSASIGVSLCPPDRADADALLRHADQAMYRAKDAGKNQFQLYDADQESMLEARRLVLEQFEQALRTDALVLHFQPQVDLITREVQRIEALVRWQHPTRGLLMPAAFLPEIEGTELEVALGEWVMRRALDSYDLLRRDGLRLPVSVNVGAHQLLHHGFVRFLRDLLAEHPQIPPSELEIEILESAALDDFERARQVLAECKGLGVRFALDDFGTGYSSLVYFRTLPIDALKIDQSFVRDMLNDQSDMDIVESVVKLSHAFNRTVIAEGVETAQHAALLAWVGCRFGQGYGISWPIPAADLPDWLSRWSQRTVWCDLDAAMQRDELPLLVAAQNHRCWRHHLSRALQQADPGQLKHLQTDHGHFERWYRGQLGTELSDWPEFQALGEHYQQVHQLGRTLTDQVRREGTAPASQELQRLGDASDAVLRDLDQLIRRFSAPTNTLSDPGAARARVKAPTPSLST